MPDPPPWRPRRADPELAKLGDKIRSPLSASAIAKGTTYQSNPEIRRMVNAALYLRRPLLITGGPGTGKSSLIDSVAYELQLGEPLRWPVTSRSTLRDALYSYDAIGRAQAKRDDKDSEKDLDVGDFIELGPLGTAMLPAIRPRALLIDEIDKADIDLPNDLLNVIEEGRYHIPELSRIKNKSAMNVRGFGGNQEVEITGGQVDSHEFPFVVMTSNGERDFPAPFLRRCLQMKMPDPCDDPIRLKAIVTAHLGSQKMKDATKLIDSFVARAQKGEKLSADQLLNAIQLVMGAHVLSPEDKTKMLESLTLGLGRKT
ncbi:MoxR family ATPase [Albitalea terrae]|uniref:MoxR family ATPase n=2 Tax=Piscinibacter terrae TaxID=2496871 RepID=A0A3N7HNL0_9BURK|nr:MoxR family ATPase [Albitalea terrae]